MIKATKQIPLDFQLRPALGKEDFLSGPENQDALKWVDRWPDWPAPVLIVSGPPASGKTHVAAVWREKSEAYTLKPSSLIALSADDLSQKAKHLVFDGLDPWLGDQHSETTLFHLYNIFKEQGRSILITMRMTPSQTDFSVADLASRLRAAPVAHIQPPGDMLLGSVLIKLFKDRQLHINNDVLRYVLPRMERSFSAANTLVQLADKMALAEKRRISVPLMRRVLENLQV